MSNGSSSPRPRVLLLESDLEEALSLEASLGREGFEVVGPFSSQAPVLQYLEETSPEIAVLDVETADGAAYAAARMLRDRDVPFILFTDFEHLDTIPPEFRDDSPFLDKPADVVLLAKIINRVLQRRHLTKA